MPTDGPVRAALAAACPVRPATPTDAVAGVIPSYVSSPGTVEEVSAVLRTAAEAGLRVVPRGLGSKLSWGAPPRACDLAVDLSGLDQLLDHAPGDMVVEAHAGVPMDRLASVVGRAGQQLAVDLPRYDDGTTMPGTVGGLLATGAAGPRRLRYGAPRDLLLGVTMVRADGMTASSGGRVVKNVAGYDLGKLLCGSYGTLGVIVSATLRLHPLPVSTRYVSVELPDPAAAATAAAAVLGSQLAPSAVELDWPAPPGPPVALAALFEGTADGAAERAESAAGLFGAAQPAGGAGLAGGAVADEPPGWFGRRPGGPAGTLVELRAAPAALAEVLELVAGAARAAGQPAQLRGSAGGAVLHAALPPEASVSSVSAFLTSLWAGLAPHSGSAVLVHTKAPAADAPAADVVAAGGVDRWGPVEAGALALMRRVKDQFDPDHRLAPGRFVGGI